MVHFLITFLVFVMSFSSGNAQDTIHVDMSKMLRPIYSGQFRCFVKDGLFKELENPVEFNPEKKSSVLLRSRDSVVIVKLSKTEFTVEPKCSAKQITLFAVDFLTNDTLQRQDFKLRNIPPNNLYLGNVTDSSEIRLLPNTLISYHAEEYIPFRCPFHIMSAEIVVLDRTFTISGDRIPKEVVDELYLLRRFYGIPNLTIQLNAKIACSSCAARNQTNYFVLI
jgi:hypothetical protein